MLQKTKTLVLEKTAENKEMCSENKVNGKTQNALIKITSIKLDSWSLIMYVTWVEDWSRN